jgi:radical SAM superfamily enzyme YgiQ (UPF0313 family)
MSNILLISYDNGSHLPVFPMNIFYLMGALKKKGHNVGVWFQDVHHQEDRFINEILANGFFDVVGIGFVAGYYPYRKINQLANLINAHEKRDNIHFVLGGHGPAGAPDFFLERTGADAVVVGDGESAICEIADGNMQSIIQSKPEFSDYPDLAIIQICLVTNPFPWMSIASTGRPSPQELTSVSPFYRPGAVNGTVHSAIA